MDSTWSVQDVARYLAVPVNTLYQWRTRGYGPTGYRVGRWVRYEPAEVRRWLHEQAACHGAR